MAFEKQRNYKDDSVAQQVEHIPFKDGVLGSSPSWVTLSAVSHCLTALFFYLHITIHIKSTYCIVFFPFDTV